MESDGEYINISRLDKKKKASNKKYVNQNHSDKDALPDISSSCFITLPRKISEKSAVVNIKNYDYASFYWSIIAKKYSSYQDYSTAMSCVSGYPHYKDVLNLTDMKIPMRLSDVPKFEMNNNLSINVFGCNSNFEIIGPYYLTKEVNVNHTNLLLLYRTDGVGHYSWIKYLGKLVSSQLIKQQVFLYMCDGCLMPFGNTKKLYLHKKNICKKKTILLDRNNSKTKYNKHNNDELWVRVIY